MCFVWDEERRYRVRTKEKGTRQESEGEKGESVGGRRRNSYITSFR